MSLPPYSNFPNLQGDVISLRQIQNNDLADIVEISYYDGIKATSIKEAKEMDDKIVNDYQNSNTIHWGIIDNASDNIVGTCGYYRGFANSTGELGCVLLSKFRGQGYMTKALDLAITFGKNDIGLEKIIAITNLQNLKAIQLLERLNFSKIDSTTCDENVTFEWNRS